MKMASTVAFALAMFGFLLLSPHRSEEEDRTSSPKEATTAPPRSDRFEGLSSKNIPPEDFLIVKDTGKYTFHHPGDGTAAITEIFRYAEPFKEGYARVETQTGEFLVIDREGSFVEKHKVPEGLGWSRVSKKEDLETGIDYFVGPDGLPLSTSKEVLGVTDPRGTSHSIIQQGETFFFGGKTYHEGSFSSREEVFLSTRSFREITLDPSKDEPTYWVFTQERERLWILDSEVTAFLRDPDFKPSLDPPIDYFGKGGPLEGLTPSEQLQE